MAKSKCKKSHCRYQSQNRNMNIGANFRFLKSLSETAVWDAFQLQTEKATVMFLKDVAEHYAWGLYSSTAF